MQVECETEPRAGVLRLGGEFLQVGGGKVLARDDQDRRAGHETDGLEVLRRVVAQVGIERGRRAVRAHVAHRDGVAVGRCLLGAGDAGGTAGAGDVLDDELLSQRLGKIFADDTGDDVGRAAGGKRYDDSHRLGGIVLGKRRGRERQCGGERRKQRLHGILLG